MNGAAFFAEHVRSDMSTTPSVSERRHISCHLAVPTTRRRVRAPARSPDSSAQEKPAQETHEQDTTPEIGGSRCASQLRYLKRSFPRQISPRQTTAPPSQRRATAT